MIYNRYKTFRIIDCNIKKYKNDFLIKIILLSILSVIIFYAENMRMINFAAENSLSTNQWDGIIRVISSPFYIIWLFMPFILFLTSNFNISDSFNKYVALKSSTKFQIFITRFLTTALFNFIACFIFYAIPILLSIITFNEGHGWSEGIKLVTGENGLFTYFYVNNFINDLSPLQAVSISFIKLFIGTMIIVLVREFCIYYFNSYKLSILIPSLYIAFGQVYISTQQGILKYINLTVLTTLQFNNYTQYSGASISINESLVIGLVLVIIFFSLNLITFRRSKNDLI